MTEPTAADIAALLGEAVLSVLPMHGGDLSDVSEVRLASGRSVVVKSGPLVAVEARMLAAIAAAGCPAPEVIAAGDGLLAMEHLHEGPAQDWAALGTALRRLHAATGADYGWPEDYAFGSVQIPNAAAADWPEFWARRRLLAAPGALPGDIRRRVAQLCDRLSGLLPSRPPAALLHGDLWGGNLFFAGAGPRLIDPACYYGDAEVDLAMLHLFGRPGPGFAAAYGPPAPGWEERRPIYQLWPALVHLRLFGAGYRGMVENLLAAAGV